MADDPFEVIESSGLTDADWAEINKLQRAYRDGGKKGLSKAMAELAKDPIRFATVVGAFFPEMIREAIKDAMAEAGMTEEDLREMIRKLESPARNQ
jgi:pyruvate/2-oxoglutarate dehydrogenase complex dihydrolipoamide dehydrogenase (E3) component